jgi:hypothetical protein
LAGGWIVAVVAAAGALAADVDRAVASLDRCPELLSSPKRLEATKATPTRASVAAASHNGGGIGLEFDLRARDI